MPGRNEIEIITSDERVREILEEIKTAAPDFERQHGLEDHLWAAVLLAISKYNPATHDAQGWALYASNLASLALRSLDVDFDRWGA
jgi:hypothetical protein